VPLTTPYAPSLVVATTFVPGANRSTEPAPYAENVLTVSAAVDAPTVTMFQSGRLAGQLMAESRLPASLPAAATIRTSCAAA
jgi:hypothetical protein